MTPLALPTMMQQSYSHALSCETIVASGVLVILISPSIMLIIMAHLLGWSKRRRRAAIVVGTKALPHLDADQICWSTIHAASAIAVSQRSRLAQSTSFAPIDETKCLPRLPRRSHNRSNDHGVAAVQPPDHRNRTTRCCQIPIALAAGPCPPPVGSFTGAFPTPARGARRHPRHRAGIRNGSQILKGTGPITTRKV